MGKQFNRIGLGIFFFALATTLCSGKDSESNPSKSKELRFTIRSTEGAGLIWGVNSHDGKKKELGDEEMRRLYEETIFPRVLRDAKEGKEPEVWQIGFFYLDGQGTEKNIEKAEDAFRVGMELQQPAGLLFFGNYFQEQGIAARLSPIEREEHFNRAEEIFREVLDAGHNAGADHVIHLAKSHLFGWYGLEADPERADSLLGTLEQVAPENPSCQLWRAKVYIAQKKYTEAFDYAQSAQMRFVEQSQETGLSGIVEEEWKLARALKITAAVFSGEISKIDPDEFLEISKESLGLTGAMAWSVPVVLLLILIFLLWRTDRSWAVAEGPELASGPGLRLSITWISAAILAAGIGFNIRLPGLDNGAGHWIGAIMVTIISLVAITMAGWSRYFGSGPVYRGVRPILLGLGIVVAGIVGMQLIATGYSVLYELVLGREIGQQLVSLFLQSETLWPMLGTLVIVGIAIPFYEEVFFRGFLFEALERRWNVKTALIASSVAFALVHGLTFAVPLLFLSFALGWLRVRNGNLRMCFVLHAANNSFAVLVGYFTGG